MIIAIILPFIVVMLTTNDLAGYFAAVAAALISATSFFKHRTTILRGLNLISACLWLTFAIMMSSTPMAIAETLGIIAIIYGALRHEQAFADLRAQLKAPFMTSAHQG